MNITAKFANALSGAKFLAAATAMTAAVTFSGAALANIIGPTAPPGETAGLDLATPLPQGVYFVDIASIGNLRGGKGDTGFDYNVPALVWSTPWDILGAKITLLGALPEVSVSTQSGLYARGLYNPLIAGQLRWNLGGGFSVSYLAGGYIGITGTNLYNSGFLLVKDPINESTFYQVLGLAWHNAEGWNATANLKYGIVFDNQTNALLTPKKNADFFNYELGLTKTIGKWEVGMIAYGSVMNSGTYNYNFGGLSINVPYACSGCSQFALGGLVGYNFGPVITQLTVATDLYAHSNATILPGAPAFWQQKETRGVLRAIVPLWNPAPPVAVAAKY
jgi:hypothetical protein